MTDLELYRFFEELVQQLRSRGVICGITSGMACVHYGVAETTQDCDLLCHLESFDKLLRLLGETAVGDRRCHYRGHISPPLAAPWHCGGWTSHFVWDTEPEVTALDIFGRAVRQFSPWENDLAGLYAGMNVVAEMKRTDRDKDWPAITALGTDMLRARDPRGWLHLFDADTLLELQEESRIPDESVAIRPVLELAIQKDSRLRPALLAERHFWQEIDRLRIRIYRAALRAYVVAVTRAKIPDAAPLREQHAARLICAESTLPINPVRAHGVQQLLGEARQATAALVQPDLLRWLPNAHPYFTYLEE